MINLTFRLDQGLTSMTPIVTVENCSGEYYFQLWQSNTWNTISPVISGFPTSGGFETPSWPIGGTGNPQIGDFVQLRIVDNVTGESSNIQNVWLTNFTNVSLTNQTSSSVDIIQVNSFYQLNQYKNNHIVYFDSNTTGLANQGTNTWSGLSTGTVVQVGCFDMFGNEFLSNTITI
jgi:hypothetical protein